MLKKVLVANRGEIAVRICRTLREMGIASVGVYSEADRFALHARMADEAYFIGPAAPNDSYMNPERILDAARLAGADGLHPGYGFLSENADFAEACERRGVTFIGPPAAVVREMGGKVSARERMRAAGVPVVPGGSADTLADARRTAAEVGYPVMLKAVAGGGGKGMRRVERPEELASAFQLAASEAQSAFSDRALYVEKLLVSARHVEIQVLGDREGNLVHLFERDCSLQRRHQKIVEETPSPGVTRELVREMGKVAVKGAAMVGYHSAGTLEFLVSEEGYFFLEMNTRIQVEHPITELVTGIDLVRQMVDIAGGERLPLRQKDIVPRGAAIECRIYAEDPREHFVPRPGTVRFVRSAAGPGVRDDSGVESGARIPPDYDPLIAKLSAWAPQRDTALARMRRALNESAVDGVSTNLDFLRALLENRNVVSGDYDIGFVEAHRAELLEAPVSNEDALIAAALAAVFHVHQNETTLASATSAAPTSAWVSAHRARMGRVRG